VNDLTKVWLALSPLLPQTKELIKNLIQSENKTQKNVFDGVAKDLIELRLAKATVYSVL
jgi:hypothetical protein